jgi:hypothetical protein
MRAPRHSLWRIIVLLTYRQFKGGEAYAIDPTHIAAVVREKEGQGDAAYVVVRTNDGREYVVEGDFDTIVAQINKTF